MSKEDADKGGITWKRAITVFLGESVYGYLLKYLLPTVVIGSILGFFLMNLLSGILGSLSFITFLFPLFLVLVVGLYPKLVAEQRKAQIEDQLHLFITSLSSMATTDIPRIGIFKEVARKDYGAVSEEAQKIVNLTENWNQSLDEAIRFQAERISSPVFKDFLERLAFNIEAGQEIQDFIEEEKEVVVQEYQARYNGALDDLDILQDLFLSMVLSTAFVIVFAIVIPILVGVNPAAMIAGGIVLYAVSELGFLYATKKKLPKDPIWLETEEIRYKKELVIGLIGSIIVLIITVLIFFDVIPIPLDVPIPVYYALPTTPLLYPGIKLKIEESKIRKRDKAFPSFIRSLGAVEKAEQSTTTQVLKSLRTKNFGTLTPHIRNLYKRLNMRINQQSAWEHFIDETDSYLIQKFSQIYHRGRDKGGDTELLGQMIGDTFEILNELRNRRQQTAITFIGVLYGMTSASVFAFFIGVEVVKVMIDMIQKVNLPQQGAVGNILHSDVYVVSQVMLIITGLIIINAVIGSIMIKVVDGGKKINAILHFTLLMWLGAITATVTGIFVGTFISVG